MSKTAPTLGLLFQAAEDSPASQLLGAGVEKHLAGKLARLPGLAAGALKGELANAFAQILDINVVDLLCGGWSKLKELQSYRDQAQHPPNEVALLALGDHSITSTHRPSIRVLVSGAELAKLDFDLTVELAVEAAQLKIRSGRILALISGDFAMRGAIALDGVNLLSKESEKFQIPGEIGLGEGIEIPAL